MKSQTLTFFATLCLCTASAITAHAWSPPIEEIECTSDADCGSDEFCALVAPAICELDEETGDCLAPDESELSGFCAPLEDPQSDRCDSDSDCGPGFYCEQAFATCDVGCAADEECEVQCDDPELSGGTCVEYDILHDTDCFDNADCLPGFYCEYVDDPISPEVPPGHCVQDVLEGECSSDEECGEGFRCEIVDPGCQDTFEQDSELQEDCEYQEAIGYCVENDVVHPIQPAGCMRDSDCGPDEFCSPDGYCEYNWVIPSPIDESCYADEDCGPGGFCVNSGFDCVDGAECMMPAIDEPGYCEYDVEPMDESECIVAVYGMCVVYAGEDSEVSCDASSGAPTWLAFLAMLGLVRRRKDRRA
jgi:uncharacterized protein (TIGR03382 family)